ncbi:hypothetical protein Tco_0149323 [Tanacetum coccineum]
MTPDLIFPSTYQPLRSSSGDSGPNVSLDMSTSSKYLSGLARASLAEIGLRAKDRCHDEGLFGAKLTMMSEAIHLILTRIKDDIYSTVYACKTIHDMWIAIERFYKMMNEMVRSQLEVATMQVNVQFQQQLQPEWSRFKQVNEIRAEKIARNANPLALVVAAQQYLVTYYQAPKPHKPYAPPSKQSSSTRSHASTRYKGKEIAKPITPPSESAYEEDNDLE